MDPFKPWEPKPRQPAPLRLTTESAQALALKALAFIAADQSLLSRFVEASGCGLEGIRERAADPAFLGGVLDFVLADEATLLAFAAAEDVPPETPMQARSRLP